MAKTYCPACNSSDALETSYASGPYCFSCKKKFSPDMSSSKEMSEEQYTVQVIPYRGHSKSTLIKYGVTLKVSEATGDIIDVSYPYPNDAVKFRQTHKGSKKFSWSKHAGPGLFGKNLFSSGSAMAVTITEGEEDTLSVYEMLGSKYPVVSVQSSGQAVKDCIADKEWLDGFEKIYLCFDNDTQGQAAAAAVSTLFPYNKIYIVNLTKYKDANEYQLAHEEAEFKRVWYNAKRYEADNLVSSFTSIREFLAVPKKTAVCTFPFQGLQEATLGIRTGETYLFKALEGIGKTELLGAVEYHAAKTTNLNLGIIHLEEDIQRSVFRFVNYELGAPVHLQGINDDITIDDKMTIYQAVAKEDNRINFYKKGKNDESTDSFLNAVRFMVASAGCKLVFFDHITRLSTAFRLDDERKELDYVSTKLSELAEELDFALLMITHVNDDGQTRGSRNISKEAWTVISLKRDTLAENPLERNTTRISIEKNRHASTTGPVGEIYFNPVTFMLTDDKPVHLPPLRTAA